MIGDFGTPTHMRAREKQTSSGIIRGTKYRNAPAMLATSGGVTQEVSAPMCSKSIPNSTTEPIPYGYCHCGCGGKTVVSNRTDKRRGWVIGEPRKFINNHHMRLPEFNQDVVAGRNRNRKPREPFWSEDDQCFFVPLTKGMHSKIDAVDVDRVGKLSWFARPRSDGCTWYGYNSKIGQLHRLVMDCPDGYVVDHINGDGLDNRRSNLRICTNEENLRNRTRTPAKSGFIGVQRDGSNWRMNVTSANESVQIGGFFCPVEAAVYRDMVAIEIHGGFAGLNFPELASLFHIAEGGQR